MKIITNHTRRPLLYPYQLTKKELSALDNPQEHEQFFRYRGNLYQLSEFCRIIAPNSTRCHPTECAEPAFQGWAGYSSESFFSGILIKFSDDFQDVIVGRCMS